MGAAVRNVGEKVGAGKVGGKVGTAVGLKVVSKNSPIKPKSSVSFAPLP